LAAFLGITSIQIISVVARLWMEDPSAIQSAVVILGLLIAVWAGWIAIRILRWRLWHSALLGVGLSFGTHWALPIFHRGTEIFGLVLINSIIVAATTTIGGCLAIVFRWAMRRFQAKRNEARSDQAE
jgi:uncharacterized membrane protein YjgN (DUF898 family)